MMKAIIGRFGFGVSYETTLWQVTDVFEQKIVKQEWNHVKAKLTRSGNMKKQNVSLDPGCGYY